MLRQALRLHASADGEDDIIDGSSNSSGDDGEQDEDERAEEETKTVPAGSVSVSSGAAAGIESKGPPKQKPAAKKTVRLNLGDMTHAIGLGSASIPVRVALARCRGCYFGCVTVLC